MSIFKLEGATLTPSVEDPNKMYMDHDGTRYIFEDGVCIGWYRPNLGRVL